jgi:[phosphatase 2A protein]-leucine-carboxy methyltransferase
MLDEVEELDLVLEHYAITWGLKLFSSGTSNMRATWGQWGLKLKHKNDTER